ncbi:MAG TPA: UvrD-helicase domain-containing protein [Bryobacteraceae bacterium]|jgi:ATP-dependent exoDNAse (exonuclease V) beta subunit|nr:UvrD-helicase domain-containing protein [Bryobacteraceae bacterium]
MIADSSQRQEALDPSRSFIVQAPAGSGKTGLLVARYLKLLATVDKPESIVAMTFTRKAAGELRDRILDALAATNEEPDPADEHKLLIRNLARAALAQDARHGWNLLADSSRLQLQTIDSLCAMLARQMPIVSGFHGSVEVLEQADELYYSAAAQTLRRLAEGSDMLQDLLTRIGVYFDSDFNILSAQIVSMLRQRDQWRTTGGDVSEQAADFLMLLHAAETVLRDVFRERGQVDFTAITEAAIQVLGSPEQPSDVLYGLDYRIQHLLVDEFQDTSLAQYKLIDALTAQWSDGDGRTLFLVGDPMQSIYRFRGAEVSLFVKTWNERRMKSVRLEPLALETNFRSTPQILSWIDQQFASILPAGGGDEVAYRPAHAAREIEASLPEWRAFVGDDGREEAAAVVELVNGARAQGSVAILVRNRRHLVEVLPALRAAGIEYEAVEIDELSTRQHILDLLSLARALLNVADRTAWLAVLRAPWCGLTITDFTTLAETERARNILELLADPIRLAALSPEGREAAGRTAEILSAAVERAGRLSLRSLVEDTWLLLGGPSVLRNAYEAEDARTFLNLLDALDEGGVIHDFAQLNARLEILFAKGAPSPNCVQVMTIFRAKGLEFDTVILPKLEGSAKGPERELIVWNESIQDDGTNILQVAAQPRKGEKSAEYDAIQGINKEKDRQELKRLLYVACTRARDRLYLLGNVGKKSDGSIQKPRSGCFLELLWPHAEREFASTLRRSGEQLGFAFAQQNAPAKAEPQTILRRLPEGWHLPRFSRWIDWQPEFRQTTPSARPITYEWVSDTARHVGTVVHELLKQAAGANWTVENADALLPVVSSELLRLGVPAAEHADAVERVRRAVVNTVTSERGRWLLAAHREARSEFAIGGRLGDQVISGTVDRIFRDEKDRLWIVDFKTSEHQGARLERFLNEEQRRYRAQLENYAALLARIERGPIWLALYFPLLDAWREWQYEEITAVAK